MYAFCGPSWLLLLLLYLLLMFLIITSISQYPHREPLGFYYVFVCMYNTMRASKHPVDHVGIYNGVMHMIITI